jgi:hypothetical protein
MMAGPGIICPTQETAAFANSRNNAPARRSGRSHATSTKKRDHARSFAGTPGFDQSSNQRKKVEMRFAHLKTHHRFERMRLRGLSGARDEFHLAATVQNLKTLANYLWPRRNSGGTQRRPEVNGRISLVVRLDNPLLVAELVDVPVADDHLDLRRQRLT